MKRRKEEIGLVSVEIGVRPWITVGNQGVSLSDGGWITDWISLIWLGTPFEPSEEDEVLAREGLVVWE